MVEINTLAVLSVKKDTNTYVFQCSNGAPLGELFDVLCQMRSYVAQRIQEAQKSEEPPQEV